MLKPSQAVQDLLWVVNSPSLAADPLVAPAPALAMSDLDPEHLERHVLPGAEHRVGRYFEQLLGYWIEHVRGCRVEGMGVQLREGKRTIGELDFLFYDEAETLVHCEASVKFFLHFPQQGQSSYPGPNATDSFERKTHKLFDQQLPAGTKHVAGIQRSEAFVRGMIFYRLDQHGDPTTSEELPDRLARGHLRGVWLRFEQLDRLRSLQGDHVAVVHKPHWLAPAVRYDPLDHHALADWLHEHFTSGRAHPIMLSIRNAEGAELHRAFVVGPDWPGKR